jgi:hypothetical protein
VTAPHCFFSLASGVVISKFVIFSQNKSSKTYLRPLLLPGGKKWQHPNLNVHSPPRLDKLTKVYQVILYETLLKTAAGMLNLCDFIFKLELENAKIKILNRSLKFVKEIVHQ